MFKIFTRNQKTDSSVTTKVMIKLDGMHCVSCGMNIDGELEDLPGVLRASTSYAKSLCTVEYDPQQIKERDLIQAIKKLGYSANIEL